MSNLASYLGLLKTSGADHIVLAPHETPAAMVDGKRKELSGDRLMPKAIFAVAGELLSQDDLRDLPRDRPRIVRHEHDGEQFIMEIAREGASIRLALRYAQARPNALRRFSKANMKAVSQRPPSRNTKAPKKPSASGIEIDLAFPRHAPVQIEESREDRERKEIERARAERAVMDRERAAKVTIRDEDRAREVREAERAREAERVREAERTREAEKAREAERTREAEKAREAERTREAEKAREAPKLRETPKPAVASGGQPIDELLRLMLDKGASDLHLSAGNHPVLRIHGEMHFLKERPVLTTDDIEELVRAIMTDKADTEFDELRDADFAYELAGAARFRVNVFEDRKGVGAVLRQIPIQIKTADELGLPKACLDLCFLTKGLVVVTGPTGSGKSTTLAAMIDHVNKNRADHIITIEDPVEFVHPNIKCLVNQREVGLHTKSFKGALRAALREDPDIVLVGEMRDLETIAIAIETAETGHLVFGTLHTTTATSTIDRIIDQFPSDRQAQIRVMLSESLKGVIAQVLCKKIGGGRIAANEILIGTSAVSALIRDGKTFQLPSVMQTQKSAGMVTLNDSLFSLVQRKLVEPKEAWMKAVDKTGLLSMFKNAGLPSAF